MQPDGSEGAGRPRLASLVNPRTGLVRTVQRFTAETGDAPLCIAGAEVADPRGLGAEGILPPAGGAGWDWEAAEAAAIGEACERTCAAFVDEAGLVWSSGRDLPGAVQGWALFSADQHARAGMPFAPWDAEVPLWWAPAWDLARNRAAWVPAQMLHMPYRRRDGEPVLAPSYSTGLAAAADPATAAERGLLEVVERDAFALWWLSGAAPPELDPSDEPPAVRRLRRFGSFRVLDLTHDVGLPTYGCLLEKASAVGTVYAVGAACRPSAAEAAEKAVVEAFQSYPYIRELARAEPAWRAAPDLSNLVSFRDHCRFYTMHPEARVGLAPWLDAPGAARPLRPDVPGGLPAIVGRLASHGLRPLVADLTTVDVASAGIRVVRALVPEAQPLHGSYQSAHLAGPRWQQVQGLLGLSRTPVVNRWPHPFA